MTKPPRLAGIASGGSSAGPDASEIFNDALQLPELERQAFLDRACVGNSPLRMEIEALLEVATEQPELLQHPSHFQPPTVLGRYRLIEERGRGAMGVVYEALDTRLNRRLAIKFLNPQLAGSHKALERFAQEARHLASLKHARIATVYDFEEIEGFYFLTMELVEGNTLAELLQQGALPVRDALELGHQLADALKCAHAQGIVHRDLKPANIAVLPDQSIKVLDFGIAKTMTTLDPHPVGFPSNASTQTAPQGTPDYMSPEQQLGLQVDHRADIWAFGCVLFECLTGKSLASQSLRGTASTERLAAEQPVSTQRQTPFYLSSLPPRLPRSARSLIESCLQSEPGARPQSASMVSHVCVSSLSSLGRQKKLTRYMFALIAAAGLLIGGIVMRGRPPIVAAQIVDDQTIKGVDVHGHTVWIKKVVDSYSNNELRTPDGEQHPIVQINGKSFATIATFSGLLNLLDARNGNVIFSRRPSWVKPTNARGLLHYRWYRSIQWPGASPAVLASLVDGQWYSSALQFLNMKGQLLATYYHPGRLWCHQPSRWTQGRDEELILFGDNSSARFVPSIAPRGTGQHCGCVVILGADFRSGQAYPYSEGMSEQRDWPGMQRASEASYLIIPPLLQTEDATVTSAGYTQDASGARRIDASTRDGRFFTFDTSLRPLTCLAQPNSPHYAELKTLGLRTLPVFRIEGGKPVRYDVRVEYQ